MISIIFIRYTELLRLNIVFWKMVYLSVVSPRRAGMSSMNYKRMIISQFHTEDKMVKCGVYDTAAYERLTEHYAQASVIRAPR